MDQNRPPAGPEQRGAGPRTLGRTDLVVGPLAYGCWRFSGTAPGEAQEKVEAALDAGMTLVDTADIYGFGSNGTDRSLPDGFGDAEAMLGQVLTDAPHLRDEIVLATKGGIHPPTPYDSSPDAYRTAACEASLHRLGVETIDLYQVHRPDLFAHPESVAETLLSLVAEGKIRAIGISNHTAAQHGALHAYLGVTLATSQPEYSVCHLDPLRDGTFDSACATASLRSSGVRWRGRVGRHRRTICGRRC